MTAALAAVCLFWPEAVVEDHIEWPGPGFRHVEHGLLASYYVENFQATEFKTRGAGKRSGYFNGAEGTSEEEAVWVAMCNFRQAGHQQAASAPGTGTIAGSSVHQHGPAPPSAIAQPKAAPQRVQLLIVQAR